MQLEQILEKLSAYQQNKGRLAVLEVQISEMKILIQNATGSLLSDLVLKSPEEENMPHGNLPTSQVENIACKLADGWVSAEIKEMEAELKWLVQEWEKLKIQVAYVDAWLRGLNEKQRFVIVRQVIMADSWREVVSGYRQKFGDSVSKETVKRIRIKALCLIEEMTKNGP